MNVYVPSSVDTYEISITIDNIVFYKFSGAVNVDKDIYLLCNDRIYSDLSNNFEGSIFSLDYDFGFSGMSIYDLEYRGFVVGGATSEPIQFFPFPVIVKNRLQITLNFSGSYSMLFKEGGIN